MATSSDAPRSAFRRYVRATWNVIARFFSQEVVIIVLAIIGAVAIANGLMAHDLWAIIVTSALFLAAAGIGVFGLGVILWEAILDEVRRLD